MLKIAALTSGLHVPSARFRVRQYVTRLAQLGISVEEHFPQIAADAGLPGTLGRLPRPLRAPLHGPWALLKLAQRLPGIRASQQADLTWLQKPLLRQFPSLEATIKSPVAFDLDDATWLASPFGAAATRLAFRVANAVIAGNSYLAEHAAKAAKSAHIHIIATGIDTTRFQPREVPAPNSHFTIGWTGSSGNFKFLFDLERPLALFLSRFPEAELSVVADRRPSFTRIPQSRVRFTRWTPDVEALSVQDMDVGLMPLPDTPWTRGKCSFKMLQYMACGVPVIVSPVGMNVEVLRHADVGFGAQSHTDWTDALEHLLRDSTTRRQLGQNGAKVVRQHYSVDVIAGQLASVFRRLC